MILQIQKMMVGESGGDFNNRPKMSLKWWREPARGVMGLANGCRCRPFRRT